MFHLKTKDKFRKNLFFIKLITNFFLFPSLVLLPILNVINYKSNNLIDEKVFFYINTTLLSLSFFLTILYIFLTSIIKRFSVNKVVYEHLEVLSKVKMPQKLPKVVYVYTTHNDFMPSRILQNMQQTYKNIEYWISDGSSNEITSREIAEFAKKHKVNLFKMDRPSKDKSDNLNTFLDNLYKQKNDFEYIVTSDSDVAFQNEFVETAIKYFYSSNFNRIGFVNSSLIDYVGNNFYNFSMANYESTRDFLQPIMDSLEISKTSEMFGACSIVKREFLMEVNNGYFSELYEDWYTKTEGIKKLWKGITTPLVLSMQSMEKEIFSTLKRYMRYFDWKALYFKKNLFNRFNDEYEKVFQLDLINSIFYLPKIIIYLLFFSLSIFLITISVNNILLLTPFILLIVINLSKTILSYKVVGFKGILSVIFIFPFWNFALSIKRSSHWFKSVLMNKISSFTPTRSNLIKKNSSWKKIRIYLINFIVSFSILICINYLWFLYSNSLDNKTYLFLIILVNCYLSYWLLGNFSILFLYLMSFIKINKKYSDSNFIVFENKFTNFTKIKEKFISENDFSSKGMS